MQHLRTVYLLLGFVLIFTNLLNANSEYKYSYVPKKVYENQLFPVTVIGIGDTGTDMPEFTFDTSSQIQPLFQKPLVIRNGNDSFYTFYFQAKERDIRIPTLFISSPTIETHFLHKTSL